MAVRSIRAAARACRGSAIGALVVCLGLQAGLQTGTAASQPFAGLDGKWSGAGTLTLGSGESERLRCRVTYTVGEDGNRLQQDLRCASDSYRFDVESEISYNSDAGRVSGKWAETNYGVGGFLSGTVKGGAIEAKVEGRSFSATVAVSTSGDQQSVTIRPQGTEVTEVTVTLKRNS